MVGELMLLCLDASSWVEAASRWYHTSANVEEM